MKNNIYIISSYFELSKDYATLFNSDGAKYERTVWLV